MSEHYFIILLSVTLLLCWVLVSRTGQKELCPFAQESMDPDSIMPVGDFSNSWSQISAPNFSDCFNT